MKKMMKYTSQSNVFKYILPVVLILLCITMISVESYAQCPMCRAAAETNLAQGGTEGKGLNTGILYMLSLPYLLIATIGYLWWRNRKEESQA